MRSRTSLYALILLGFSVTTLWATCARMRMAAASGGGGYGGGIGYYGGGYYGGGAMYNNTFESVNRPSRPLPQVYQKPYIPPRTPEQMASCAQEAIPTSHGERSQAADRLYELAVKSEKAGHDLPAIANYDSIIRNFPETHVASDARAAIDRILTSKERAEAERQFKRRQELNTQKVNEVLRTLEDLKNGRR